MKVTLTKVMLDALKQEADRALVDAQAHRQRVYAR